LQVICVLDQQAASSDDNST